MRRPSAVTISAVMLSIGLSAAAFPASAAPRQPINGGEPQIHLANRATDEPLNGCVASRRATTRDEAGAYCAISNGSTSEFRVVINCRGLGVRSASGPWRAIGDGIWSWAYCNTNERLVAVTAQHR
jgi:hypothetical protein